MNKLLRITIGLLFAACGVGLLALAVPLMSPTINWPLLIPTVLIAVGALFIAWQIIAGATWRDVMDFLTSTIWF